MSQTVQVRQGSGAKDGAAPTPRSTLDAEAVRQAYRRWALVYDSSFGSVSARSRRRAAEAVNALPGTRVLEVGVGTGLALPHFAPDRRITGIDLSAEMLVRARERVARAGLTNVEALLEMDAEAMDFPDGAFDIAAAMFVASVVPHPRRLMAEMRRVVRRGGHLLFINHFMSRSGPRLWIERAMAPASRALGWHPDFAFEALFSSGELEAADMRPAPPFGLFTLAHLPN